MRPRFLILFLMLCQSGAATRTASAQALADAGYLAYGDLRGHLEPCGCDPKTDLGGLRRIAALVQRERRADAALGSFCTGNLLPLKEEGPLKTAFILEGAATIPTDACLFNALEFARAAEVKAAKVRPPFVLSNLKGRKDLSAIVKPKVETSAFVVLGYVSPLAVTKDLEALSEAVLERWRALLAKTPKKAKILLFSGGDADLSRIEKAKIFDAVVSANTSPLDTIVGTREKDDEHRLERSGSTTAALMVPLGGQGVLRGGKARFSQAKSIGDLLQRKDDVPSKPLLGDVKLVTWLDTAYADDATLKDLFDRYNQAARSEFAGEAAARTKDLAATPFAGAQTCLTCHPSAYYKWEGSKHAHAFATLQAKKKEEDPECVSCHVLGAKDKGGFVSLAASPQFANVQCETCHGPRLAHSKLPSEKPTLATAPAKVCSSGHNAQHSPAFKQDEYWAKIVHGKGPGG